MKKKNSLAIIALFVVAILGVGAVSAFGFEQGKMIGLEEDEKAEMKDFHAAREQAIQTGDYETWKSLMESRITKEHFEEMQTHRNERAEHRTEMQNSLQNGEIQMRKGSGMHGSGRMGQGNFENCPFA